MNETWLIIDVNIESGSCELLAFRPDARKWLATCEIRNGKLYIPLDLVIQVNGNMDFLLAPSSSTSKNFEFTVSDMTLEVSDKTYL